MGSIGLNTSGLEICYFEVRKIFRVNKMKIIIYFRWLQVVKHKVTFFCFACV